MTSKLAIVGVGLIGGSLALAARQSGSYQFIAGFDADRDNLLKAQQLGIIDQCADSMENLVVGADLVVIATPVGAMRQVLRALKPLWSANTVYTDVGSTKQSVIDDLVAVFEQLPSNFVPGHPIAGTENSGAEAAFVELFAKKKIVLTPTEATDLTAISIVRTLWEEAGASVTEMSAVEHDQMLAATSHLPHLAAFTMVAMLASDSEQLDYMQYVAGGFRDFTRIASSDPRMWTDISFANKQQLLKLLRKYQAQLGEFAELLEAGDEQAFYQRLVQARQSREALLSSFEANLPTTNQPLSK